MKKSLLFRYIKSIAACLILFAGVEVSAQNRFYLEKKNIVYLSSQGYNSSTARNLARGFSYENFENANVYYQFLDIDITSDSELTEKYKAVLKNYIDDKNPDIFVLADNEIFSFALANRQEYFGKKPIVFLDIHDQNKIQESYADSMITGVQDVLPLDENILLIKSIFPKAENIVFVTDNSVLGRIGHKMFYDLMPRFNGLNFIEINTSHLTKDQITFRLSAQSENTVVLYLVASHCKTGEIPDGVKLISGCCKENNIPMISCLTGIEGTDITGGYYSNKEHLGFEAARMVRDILNGIRPVDIPISRESIYDYVFNRRLVDLFGIRDKNLPSETVFINSDDISGTNSTVSALIFLIIFIVILFGVFSVLMITRQKKLREQFEENRIKLQAVMDQSETVYWECDFTADDDDDLFEDMKETSDIFNTEYQDDSSELLDLEDNINQPFALKSTAVNDPVQGWIYSGIIQKEYREQFFELLNDFKDGKRKRSIEINLPLDIVDIRNGVETERWKKIVYKALKYDGERVVHAICSSTDITSKIHSEREYERIMNYQTLVQQRYSAYSRLNLTKNVVLERYVRIDELEEIIKGTSADEELEVFRNLMTTRNQNETVAEMFNRREMIIAQKNGLRQRECDFCYQFESGALNWYRLSVELASNPMNGDIEAYCYFNDITSECIALISKDVVLNDEINALFWVDTKTRMVKIINKAVSAYWIPEDESIPYKDMLEVFLSSKITEKDKEDTKKLFDLDRICDELEYTRELSFTFHTRAINGNVEIMQAKIYYLEPNSNILVYVVNDITQITLSQNEQSEKLAKAIKSAEKANYAKSDFLSRMSHDLRTPMNGIIGISELAQKEIHNPAALEKDLEKIQSSSKYMLSLLNDILDMSKIESGKLEIRPQPVTAWECIENINTIAKVMFEKVGVTYYCNYAQNKELKTTYINIDRVHMQQVAMNLLSNASKYTPTGGRVEFLVNVLGRTTEYLDMEFVISDTGVGMTESFQKIMYEQFTQDTNSVNKVGTGLGLAIVKSLIELMGGSISCRSAPNEGTTFTINMKVELVSDEQARELGLAVHEKPADSGKIEFEGKTALLVEDNELNQEIAMRLLESKGMNVIVANNGLEALNKFSEAEEYYYDIVFMDMMMPVMDGLDATRHLRNLDRKDAKEIPVIAMTANAFTDDIEKCKEAGMNDHIAKPIDTKLMMSKIVMYLNDKK